MRENMKAEVVVQGEKNDNNKKASVLFSPSQVMFRVQTNNRIKSTCVSSNKKSQSS